MGKRFKAAVIGGSGYGGAEMIRRLLHHPDVELVRVASVDFVGEKLSAAHPNLDGVSDLCFENLSPQDAARDCDVVLLGMPHKITATKVPPLVKTGVKIVDMSGDFRLNSTTDYETYYETKHPYPELLSQFVYGLPEHNREQIRGAQYVASPGCFATAITLALLPLARARLLSGPVHVTAMTGSSGSGVAPKAGTHHPSRAGNLKAYKPLAHQHTPEIVDALTQAGAEQDWQLRFVPVSAPLTRGILVTAYVEVPTSTDHDHIAKLFGNSFAKERFVRMPTGRGVEVVAVAGSNYAEVGFALGPPDTSVPNGPTRTVVCFCVIDNLIKGGAGQAIQNMNLLLGVDEAASLEDPGSWP